jgi:hypothetical protein
MAGLKRRRSPRGDWIDRTIDRAGSNWWTLGYAIPLSVVAAIRDWWRGRT